MMVKPMTPNETVTRTPPVLRGEILGWLKEAGHIALHKQGFGISYKEDGTPVTTVDEEIEAFLLEQVARVTPGYRVLSEERGSLAGDDEFLWVIDPLDGTRAYASGLPIWSISIGLLQRERPVAGAVYLPAIGDIYWADATGAFCNDQRISPRRNLGLDDPLAFVAVPSNAHRLYDIDLPRVRSLGSTAVHLIYAATSTAIGVLTRRVRIWDVAGALPFFEHAGVSAIYLSGAPFVIAPLLTGEPLPEPLVIGRTELLPDIRLRIRRKQGAI